MKKISIVVPMYYEEDVVLECDKELKRVLKNLKKYNYEIIYVNDGSLDNTLPMLEDISKKDKNTKVVSLSRNFGHQAAVSCGLKYVSGDVVVIIDADLQDPPKCIPEMIKLWESGYEVVYGERKKRKGESFFKLFTAKMFYKILNKLSDVNIPMNTGDFRLVDRKVVDVINNLPEHNKFLRGLWSFSGFKQTSYLYERDERFAGTTKYSLKKMLKLASDGIIGFSYKPLKLIFIMSFLSLFISFASLVVMIVFIIKSISYMIPFLVFLFGLSTGIILLSIWILSIYVSRIYDEVRNRPSYIVDKTFNL